MLVVVVALDGEYANEAVNAGCCAAMVTDAVFEAVDSPPELNAVT